MLAPRSYQTECVSSIWNYFAHSKGNPVAALPTGTGKSVIIAMFIHSVLKQYFNQRILVLAHVQELLEQNHEKLVTLWPAAPAGIYSAGLGKRDINSRILFAGIASIAKHWQQLGHIDLILIDECQLVSANSESTYVKFIENLKTINPKLKVIGFTATPYRLGMGSIVENGTIFNDLCFDITGLAAFNRLIAEGYLAPLVPKRSLLNIDLDGIKMSGGDFQQADLQKKLDKYEITEAALKEVIEQAEEEDRKCWLIFASGVEHAINIAAMLNTMGVPTGVVHGGLSKGERKQVLDDFKNGVLTAVVNNNVLTTGFDNPKIDLIVMLRPTCSPGLWVQMLGRGTRPFPGKEYCLVMDFSGNTKRLGPINDPVVPRKKGKKGGTAPVKNCPKCRTDNHASLRFCCNPRCDYEFPIETKLNITSSNKEIIKGDLPITEVFNVSHVTYAKHEKQGSTPSLKVTYYCGSKHFTEYVGIENPQPYLQKKSRAWWAQRSSMPCPPEVDIALKVTSKLNAPTQIRVWTNKKYPEILACCYDGTSFGTLEAPEEIIKPTTETVNVHHPTASSQGYANTKTLVKQALQVIGKSTDHLDEDLDNAQPVDTLDDDLPF